MRRPWAAVFLAATLAASCLPREDVDLLFRGGTLIDGTGAVPRTADVAIVDGRIYRVGPNLDLPARREIDVSGSIIAPGFVDMHSHADAVLLADTETRQRLMSAKIRQGVTSVVVGNCGLGFAPAVDEARHLVPAVNGWMTPQDVEATEASVGLLLRRMDRDGIPLNVGTLVPHGPIRMSVMGLATGRPSPDQLRRMHDLTVRALDEGALGLSVGLIYPPGMYSDTDELVTLAREAAARDRVFTAHVRGSSETLLAATRELVEIARRSGARTHHAHLEAVGEPFWPQVAEVLTIEDQARAEGLDISHGVFPYTRAATMMAAIFPPWSLEGGIESLLGRLDDAPTRRRIAREIRDRVPEWPPWNEGGWPHNLVGAVGWDGILVASVGVDGPQEVVGRSLAEIGAEQQRDPFDVVADLISSQRGVVGQLVDEISGRDGQDAILRRILAHPAAAVVSDAEDYGRGSPHPSHAGAFVRALRWSREDGTVPLQELVRRMSSYPADRVGLPQVGRLFPGGPADLVVFDPRTVADRATWSEPRRPATGISWVVINGSPVVENGRYLGGLPGRVLRAPVP